MLSNIPVLVSAVLMLTLLGAQAVPASELNFAHKDWEVVWDNTRTCRAAGYQNDDDKLPVSVLLTRKAGPGEPVTGKLTIGDYDMVVRGKSLASFRQRRCCGVAKNG
ncbi:MAG: DUF1176 domain-containing protein [Gammaproteobacteria bacterium]